ncbi:MAG: O-acetyl-ADP-ribose deacetylase [Polyangiaceae bacterium]|jgi:O-acetyl-ADP-ribose deacetylase (regulator of RNase III)
MVRVEVATGDITVETTDAIVNAANSSLLGGGGVDGAIHKAAGPALMEACRRLRSQVLPDGLATGQAVATPGYALAARWVIHTVGPMYWASAAPERELAACHISSLAVADELGANSVAFPAISAGAYGYPLVEAASIALRTVKQAETRVEWVRFILFNPDAYAAFARAAEEFAGR